jgi:putative tryptophan/tyrosine transport system substrate-binding protein
MRRSSWSRRGIIVGSASLLLLPGARASAQPTRRRPKVGFLIPTAPDDVDTPWVRVRAGLAELGYVDGQTVSLEARFAHHRLERLPALAAELVAGEPGVIHTWTSGVDHALAAATSTIPIVVAPINERVLSELVGDMVRPSGNITGLTLDSRDQQEKCLQILKEAAPHITRVGVLRNPLNPAWRHYPEVLNDAARALGLELVGADARGPEEIDPAFAAMAAAGVDAFFFLSEPTFIRPLPVLQRIVELINTRGWPSTSHERLWARSGGLLSLSSDHRAIGRGAALYIHRILQGAKPSELPVIHPTRFELVLNLKTAKALGLTFPLPELCGNLGDGAVRRRAAVTSR